MSQLVLKYHVRGMVGNDMCMLYNAEVMRKPKIFSVYIWEKVPGRRPKTYILILGQVTFSTIKVN